MTTLEEQLLSDAAVFDTVELPRGFRVELGQTIRRLPPPAPPPRTGIFRPAVQLAMAAAAAIAFLLFVGSQAAGDQNDPVGGAAGPVVDVPPESSPSLAADDRRVISESGPVVTAAAMHGTGEVRSEFVDAKLEQEWSYIKADAKALSGPFRSAMPSALIRRR